MKKTFVVLLLAVMLAACQGAQAQTADEKVDGKFVGSVESVAAENSGADYSVEEAAETEALDPKVEVITREYIDDRCPDVQELLGNMNAIWRRVDTIFNDVISSSEDGCGWRLFNFTETSVELHIPEGVVLNKPPKTIGPASIHSNYEPVTLWYPGYSEDGCPAATDLAFGTEESDWTRLDANNDGQINVEDDWCGYLLTSWETKNITFRIPEGVEADQSLVVTGPADYETNRLEASVWIVDLEAYLVEE